MRKQQRASDNKVVSEQFRKIRRSVVVGVVTSDGTAWMEIDSGNGGANVIAKHLASLLNVKRGTKEPGLPISV